MKISDFKKGFVYECLYYFGNWRRHTYGVNPEEQIEIYHYKNKDAIEYFKFCPENFRKPKNNMKWLRLKNFNLENLFFVIQGYYKKWLLILFNKAFGSSTNETVIHKLVKYQNCVGSCKDCGCPLVELILSDKTCNKCNDN